MVSHLEGFLQRCALYTPTFMGHIIPDKNQSLPAYKSAVHDHVQKMVEKGLVADALITTDLHELDKERQKEGITLCCLIPDTLDENELFILFQCATSNQADERFYFTDSYRRQNNLTRKSQDLLDSQIGTTYGHLPFVHQDFVLVFTHDPRVERLIAANPVVSQYTTRFSLS
jgi:hypothetical protein